MDGLLVLLALVALAIPVLIIVLLIGQSGLRRRVGDLERQLAAQGARLHAMLGAVDVAQAPVPDRLAPTGGAATVIAEAAPVDSVLNEAGPVEAEADAPVVEAGAAEPSRVEAARPMTPWERAAAARGAAATPAAPAPVAARLPAGPSVVSRLADWLKANWVYAVSAASLALAGVFFVQYGIENGLLPPGLRVLAGIAFGLCLIAAGEWLRRRSGDGEDVSTAYLPSVFAGAGLVSVFAAVLSARLMYGLIGPQMAFAGLVATAVLALVLGWFYGPLLIAVGLLGAFAAPFVVGGGAEAAPWLYGYFALIAALGLGVDTMRRWAWVSVLALVLGYAGGWLSMAAGAGVLGWVALLLGLALLAVAIPERGLVPRQNGPSVLLAGMLGKVRPPFPVLLAAGGALASTLGLVLLAGAAGAEAMLALGGLALLALAYVLWAERAEGLADLGFAPAVGFWLMLVQIGSAQMPLFWEFLDAADRAPEVAAPMTITLLVGMAALISGAFAWRSRQEGVLALLHGAAAALVAPVAVAILALLWIPERVIGAYPWALHVMAVAVGMVGLAVMFARGPDRRRPAYATLSALSLIALALFLVTTHTALTLALALLALVAAGLDRRFKLPEMGWFIQVAVAVLGYRLLADPGLDWAFEAPLGQVLLAFVGVIMALLAALRTLPEGRILPKGVLESAAAGLGAILATLLISRLILRAGVQADGDTFSHWGMSLQALPWLVLMLMQIYRARLGGPLVRLRQGVAVVAGGLAAAGLALAIALNPMFFYSPTTPGALVLGPRVLDTLLLAYGVPGLMLLAAVWKLPGLGRRLRLGFLVVGLALLALYLGLEIRRFWQGDWLGASGVVQGELYSYTLALMLLGAGLLYQAIARRSGLLRRVAMAVIGLTIAKVFLLDAAGLTGLTRVVSFLGLGLCLAGLAWLNRWAGEVSTQKRDA